jgi:2-polyprenyl-3-methyl-5-hydroxy-6-metoxy-1,4-benzoquinol methylase
MPRLHHLLLEQYSGHYARLNATVNPRLLSSSHLRQMDRTYGPHVAALPAGGRVLDLGCGSGYLLHWLSLQSGIVPVGVDISPSQVAVVREALPAVEVHCEDGLAFLLRHAGEFVAILCTDVLEHVAEDDACLRWVEAARSALRPGGFFLCRVPNAANLLGCYSRYVDLTHFRSFTPTSLLQLLQAAGLSACAIIPHRAGHPLGGLRIGLGNLLHRLCFFLTGHAPAAAYTSNVYAIGYAEAREEAGT